MNNYTSAESAAIGRKRFLVPGMTGIGIILVLLLPLGGLSGLADNGLWLPVLVGLTAFFFGIHWLGGITGRLILIKKWNPFITAIVATFLIVWLSALAGGITGLFMTDPANWSGAWVRSYTLKPIGAFTFWGWLPMILLAVWAGSSIEKHLDTAP